MKKSFQKMREYGFTACSGLPSIAYRGFSQGKPLLDFTAADASMKLLKELGFLGVSSYGGGVSGFDAYFKDSAAMGSAGFTDYGDFVKAIYSQVERQAVQHDWIPVYFNLADEPIGDDLVRWPRMPRSTAKPFRTGRRISPVPAASPEAIGTTPISGWQKHSMW